jgi:phage portal protein BeeE
VRKRNSASRKPTRRAAASRDATFTSEEVTALNSILQEFATAQPNLPKMQALAAQHPRLVTALDGARHRAEAKAQALGIPGDYMFDYSVPEQSGFHPDYTQARVQGQPVRGSTSQPITGYHPMDGTGIWSSFHDPSPIGVHNYRILRQISNDNVWCRTAINLRRQQVGRAKVICRPINPNKRYDVEAKRKIDLLLQQPNRRGDTIRFLLEAALEDVLTLGRGVWSKNKTRGGEVTELFVEDAATIKIYPSWDGNPKMPRYVYEEPGSTRQVDMYTDDVIMFINNPASYRFSLAPVQVLADTIRADLKATEAAMMLVDMRTPPHLIQVPNISDVALRQLKNRYEAEVMGRKEILFMGGSAPVNVKPLVFSAKENQWMEWQVWLARKIAVAFQISPQQIGLIEDVNRATAEVQRADQIDNGLIPLLLLIEEYLNYDFLADFAPKFPDGRANIAALNLEIVFPQVSEAVRIVHLEESLQYADQGLQGLPSLTLNEVRAMRGDAPVEGGGAYYIKTAQGAMLWLDAGTAVPEHLQPLAPTQMPDLNPDTVGSVVGNAALEHGGKAPPPPTGRTPKPKTGPKQPIPDGTPASNVASGDEGQATALVNNKKSLGVLADVRAWQYARRPGTLVTSADVQHWQEEQQAEDAIQAQIRVTEERLYRQQPAPTIVTVTPVTDALPTDPTAGMGAVVYPALTYELLQVFVTALTRALGGFV